MRDRTSRRTARASTKHHRIVITAFDLCVANHESGEPHGPPYRASTVDWHIVDPPYEGAYQWDPSTWAAAGGLRYGSASSATPEDQTRIFNSYERRDPGAWPLSVPACGGP
jgi:Transglycosylase-like domain